MNRTEYRIRLERLEARIRELEEEAETLEAECARLDPVEQGDQKFHCTARARVLRQRARDLAVQRSAVAGKASLT